MTALLEAPTMDKKRKRSDWRTFPRDEFKVERADGGWESLSFLAYLVDAWPRGRNWDPGAPITAGWKLHNTPRDKRGKLSGTPEMRRVFLNWLDSEHQVMTISYSEIAAALEKVKARDREAFDVLEWRQHKGPCAYLPVNLFMERIHVSSSSTLTARLYRAVELVLDEVDRGRAGRDQ